MTEYRGALVEIVERRKRPLPDSAGASLVVPNEIRINGQPIMIPRDEPIVVHDILGDDVVRVTLTVFARRIFIGHEDIDPHITGSVMAATQALAEAQRAAVKALTESTDAIEAAHRQLASAHRELAAATAEKPEGGQ